LPDHNLPLENRIQTRTVERQFLARSFGEAENGKCLLTEAGDSAIFCLMKRKDFVGQSA
jgi:hypothetical protein